MYWELPMSVDISWYSSEMLAKEFCTSAVRNSYIRLFTATWTATLSLSLMDSSMTFMFSCSICRCGSLSSS
ncbi:hypothetical protein D3C76_1402070 [compost metagenome]